MLPKLSPSFSLPPTCECSMTRKTYALYQPFFIQLSLRRFDLRSRRKQCSIRLSRTMSARGLRCVRLSIAGAHQPQSGEYPNLSPIAPVAPLPEDGLTGKLFVIDATCILRFLHFAFPKNVASSDSLSSRLLQAFTSLLIEILCEHVQADDVVIIFESRSRKVSTSADFENPWRSDVGAAVEDIIPTAKEICEELGCSVADVKKPLATEVIGNLAQQARRNGIALTIISPDRTLFQLLREDWVEILLLQRGAKFTAVTEATFAGEYGPVTPPQYPDLVVLVGEKVDGVKGVPRVRTQTIRKLLVKHGNLRVVLNAAGSFSSGYTSLQKKGALFTEYLASALTDSRDALLSKKKAVSIECKTNEPTLDPRHFERRNINVESLNELFDDMNISGIVLPDELFAGTGDDSRNNTHSDFPTYDSEQGSRFVECEEATESDECSGCDSVPITSVCVIPVISKRDNLEQIAGIAFSIGLGTPTYVSLEKDPIPSRLRNIFCDSRVEKTGWFLKDFHRLLVTCHHTETIGNLFDLDVALSMIDAGEGSTNIAMLARFVDIANVPFFNRDERISPHTLSAPAAVHLCDLTSKMTSDLKSYLSSTGLMRAIATVENPLISVLSNMEREGVPIDVLGLQKMASSTGRRVELYHEDLIHLWRNSYLANTDNTDLETPKVAEITKQVLQSPQQEEGVAKTKRINNDTLESMTGDESLTQTQRKFASRLLSARQLSKVHTYCKTLLSFVGEDGRVRPSFGQSSSSGRISTSNPNLQAIPVRALGKDVRSVVRATDGFLILCADYSQIELRIIASMSGDEALRESFATGTDVYMRVATELFELGSVEEVSTEQRQVAKEVTLSVMYGTSPYGLSKRLGIPHRDAKRFIDGFFDGFVGVKTFSDDLKAKAIDTGYASSELGRRLDLPGLQKGAIEKKKALRTAMNMPVQSTQAEMIKLAMIRVQNRLKSLAAKSRLIMQMHDELILEVAESEVEVITRLVHEEMTHAMPLPGVDVQLKMGWGTTWFEASEKAKVFTQGEPLRSDLSICK